GDVALVARVQTHPAGNGVDERAAAVPLDLVGPTAVVARQLGGLGEHRHDAALGHRLGIGVLGRVHAVHEPVLGVLTAGADERVAAAQALAGEREDDLVVTPLLGGVGAAVPD